MWFFMRTSSSWMSLRSASIAASCRMRSASACAPISSCMRAAASRDRPSAPCGAAIPLPRRLRQVLHALAQLRSPRSAFFFAHLVQPLDCLLQLRQSPASRVPRRRRQTRGVQGARQRRTAFRSGSALTPNSAAACRKALKYPPTSSRFTANAAPPLRSRLRVTSMCRGAAFP